MTDIARLGFQVDTNGLKRGRQELDRFGNQAGSTEGKTKSFERSIGSLVLRYASLTAAIGLSVKAIKDSIASAETYQRNQLRTEAILRATGNAVGFTADQLERQASALALNTLQSVDAVQKAQQALLTFRSVTGEVFDDTISLAADLASVMGGDLNSAVMQLGKALEDPTTGLTALRRSGVSFTIQQQEVIKSLVETGRQAEAQRLILSELEKQVGGTAAAEAGGLAGSFDTLSQRIDEFRANLGRAAAEEGSGFNRFVQTLAQGVDNLNTKLFDERYEAQRLFNREVELEQQLQELRESGFRRFSRDANKARALEQEINDLRERRLVLVERNEQAIRDEAAAQQQAAEVQKQRLQEQAEEQERSEAAAQAKIAEERIQRAAEEAARRQQEQESQLEALRQYLATESDFILNSYLDRQMRIEELEQAGMLSEQEAQRLRLDNYEDFQKQMTAIAEEETQARVEAEERSYQLLSAAQQSTLSAMGAMFGNFASIAREGGESQFKTWKAMASAQAAISTALAVANAMTAAPPPFNFALAASVGAFGAVQLAKIQGQEYQGARAMGGQVQAGSSYLVGERGPEVVTMGGTGNVTPNHKLGKGDTNVTQVFQLSDNARREAKQQILESAPMIRSMAKQAVLEAISQGGAMSRAVGRRS